MEYKTPERIQQLARDTVNSWGDKFVYDFAIDQMAEQFENCEEEEFDVYWDNYYGEDA